MAAPTSSAWASSSTSCSPGGGRSAANRPDELLEQIKTQEPRPPRQLDDAIPAELDRICLKALAKRASERYTHRPRPGRGPAALAGDGRPARPAPAPPAVVQVVAPARERRSASASTPPAPPRIGRPVKVVPKGLRSFDAARRRLLPGAAARPARPRRPARQPPVLEDAHRGDRPGPDLQRRACSTGRAAAASRRWSRPGCCPGWRSTSWPSTSRRRRRRPRPGCSRACGSAAPTCRTTSG